MKRKEDRFDEHIKFAFQREINLLEKARAFIASEYLLDGTEVHLQITTLATHFDKLLKDAMFLTKQANKLQANLEKSNKELEDSLQIIQEQKGLVDERNAKITESIEYAKLIQNAIFPTIEQFEKIFPKSYILFKPRELVSGDFYWCCHFPSQEGFDIQVLAVADCTGHGVPGSMLTFIGNHLLHSIVIEQKVWQPEKILQILDKGVQKILKQNNQNINSNDGMDLSILVFRSHYWGDTRQSELLFSGANQPLYILKNQQLEKLKASKYPVGGTQHKDKLFFRHRLEIEDNDRFFIFTDGFTDQFGGGDNKQKFSVNRLTNLIQQTANQPLQKQGKHISQTLQNWQGTHKQIDDITLIAIEW